MASRNGNRGPDVSTPGSSGVDLDRANAGWAGGGIESPPGEMGGDNSPPSQAEVACHLGAQNTDSAVDAFAALRVVGKENKPDLGDHMDPAWKRYPVLMGYLCKQVYDDVMSRKPSRLSLYATPLGFSVTIPDEGMGKKLTVSFTRLEDLLMALETGLRSPTGAWSELTYGEGYQKKKADERKELEKRSYRL